MTSPSPLPVGRDEILDRLARYRPGQGGGVALFGPAGIGKSTVLAAAAANAAGDGAPPRGPGAEPVARVLWAAAAEPESGLPYLTLVDLFDSVTGQEMSRLPRHLRGALDGTLLRGADPPGAPDPLAVRLAVLELLRSLAASQPVLMVIDDLQWVDASSADVLRFVARRLGGSAIGMLSAERVGAGSDPAHIDLCPPPCEEILLGPLTEYDVADLLRDRYGPVLSLVTIARIHEASAGNPLFALELGRALLPTGGRTAPAEPLPVPERLRRLLADRVAALPAADAQTLLLIAAAARPNQAVIGEGAPQRAALDSAVAAGLISVGAGGAVRFTHPLLREIVYAEASPADRTAAHQLLADRLTDPVEHARHLALARPYADEDLAVRLVEAANVARRRGAPAIAAELVALAADRTPVGSTGLAARRLAMAEHAYAAGQTDDAITAAQLALTGPAEPAVRVSARLLLMDVAGQDQSGVDPLLQAAAADAGDDQRLGAKVAVYRALKAYYDGDVEAAIADLKQAEQAATQAGDHMVLVDILATRAAFEAPQHGSDADELLQRAAALARTLPLTTETIRARQLAAMACAFTGDLDAATQQLDELRPQVERSGLVREFAGLLISVSAVALRAGRCDAALTAGRECLRLILDLEATAGPGLVVGANVELFGGSPARAGILVQQAIDACRAASDEDWLCMALAIAGQVHLFRGDPAAAVGHLREASTLERRLGRVDPAVFLWHADHVEALAAVGARTEAAAVLADIRHTAERLRRRVVMLGLDRAEAMIIASGGDARAAAEHLASAIDAQADHPYPFEVARAWHTLGSLWRRAHRRPAARAALAEAHARYLATQAVPWALAAEAALSRVDGGHGMLLSDAEHRIVLLVMSGATNGEIARASYLSVKAVEATLTRLYRRLGVRNRAQLVRALQSADVLADQVMH